MRGGTIRGHGGPPARSGGGAPPGAPPRVVPRMGCPRWCVTPQAGPVRARQGRVGFGPPPPTGPASFRCRRHRRADPCQPPRASDPLRSAYASARSDPAVPSAGKPRRNAVGSAHPASWASAARIRRSPASRARPLRTVSRPGRSPSRRQAGIILGAKANPPSDHRHPSCPAYTIRGMSRTHFSGTQPMPGPRPAFPRAGALPEHGVGAIRADMGVPHDARPPTARRRCRGSRPGRPVGAARIPEGRARFGQALPLPMRQRSRGSAAESPTRGTELARLFPSPQPAGVGCRPPSSPGARGR